LPTKLDTTFIPASYDELFRHYYQYVVKQVILFGIEPASAEDVAMSILTKFLENDALEDFDPNFQSPHVETGRKAVFATFLSGFVRTYAQHHRNMQSKRASRESVSCDETTGGHQKDNPGGELLVIDLIAEPITDQYDIVEARTVVRAIRARLEAEVPSNSQDKSNLPALFDAMLRQYQLNSEVSPLAISKEFGVTKNSIHNWIKRLRVIAAEVIEEQP
jgi:hypothetical protein